MRFAAILGCSILLLCKVAGAQEQVRPNVIVFLADDLGWADLGCYGHPRIKTPHLDAFARQGMRLTQCYAASAVCSPSRSAILTGRTPHRNGVYTWIAEGSEVHLRASELALPKLLRDAGYATCHVGKWHLNSGLMRPDQPQPSDHGYDHWLATQNNAAPSHRHPMNFIRNGEAVGATTAYSAPYVAAESIEWLRNKRDKSKPFFLTLWAHEPHDPIETEPRFQELYPGLDDDMRQHHGNVSQMDHAFGSLMTALDEQGLSDSTFVFFTSDNGPEGDGQTGRRRGSTGGLRGRKRSLYEGGIRVPGIARWPGRISPDTTSDVPVIGSDLFPTVLDLGGVARPADRTLDGADIVPLLTQQADAVERELPLYWRLNMSPPRENLHVAMREGDWKLLASQDFQHLELYNLRHDPAETDDLKEREAARFAAMRQQLETLHRQIEQEGPDWWKRLDQDGGKPLKSKP